MSKLEEKLEEQIAGVELAIVESFNVKEVQLYINVLTRLSLIRNELDDVNNINKSSVELTEEVAKLTKAESTLKETPQVRLYLALLRRHAELIDDCRVTQSITEEAPSR